LNSFFVYKKTKYFIYFIFVKKEKILEKRKKYYSKDMIKINIKEAALF